MNGLEEFYCPVCGTSNGERRFQFGSYYLIACYSCSGLYTLPRPSVEEHRCKYRESYYGQKCPHRFRWVFAEKVQDTFRYFRAWFLRRKLAGIKGKTVLDIGCGGGFFLYWLQRWGAKVYGVEVGQSAVELARERLGAEAVIEVGIEEADLADRQFDLVTMWHVLEHLLCPVAALRRVAILLKPGGCAYIEVPNAGGWSARFFGERWLAYDVPNHLSHFTPETLKRAAEVAGLRCVGIRHWSWEYTPFTFLQSLVNVLFGEKNLLFRTMSFDREESHSMTVWKLGLLALQLVAMMVLLLPSLLFSAGLSVMGRGDTFGVFVCRADDQILNCLQ